MTDASAVYLLACAAALAAVLVRHPNFRAGRRPRRPGTNETGRVLYAAGTGNHPIYSNDIERQAADEHSGSKGIFERHFGRNPSWGQSGPADIEAFLRDWFGTEDLHLKKITEYGDPANHRGLWRFECLIATASLCDRACGL